MANLAALLVYAPPKAVVELFLRADRPATVLSSGATEIVTDDGVISVDNLVEEGNVAVVADTSDDSDAFARTLYAEVVEGSPWRVTLLSADSSEPVAERPAMSEAP